MKSKVILAKVLAKIMHHQTQKWATNPVETQEKVFENLIATAKNTLFWKKS